MLGMEGGYLGTQQSFGTQLAWNDVCKDMCSNSSGPKFCAGGWTFYFHCDFVSTKKSTRKVQTLNKFMMIIVDPACCLNFLIFTTGSSGCGGLRKTALWLDTIAFFIALIPRFSKSESSQHSLSGRCSARSKLLQTPF